MSLLRLAIPLANNNSCPCLSESLGNLLGLSAQCSSPFAFKYFVSAVNSYQYERAP